MEDLKKIFIVDKDSYEKEKIPELIRKILRYCKVTKEGPVIIEEKSLILKDKIKLILIARFLANKIEGSISEEVSVEELVASIGSNKKDSIITRASEVINEGVAKRTAKGKYSIIPFYIEAIINNFDKKIKKDHTH